MTKSRLLKKEDTMDIAETAQDLAHDPAGVGAFVVAWLLDILPSIGAALLILIVGFVVAGWASRAVARMLVKRERFDATLIPVVRAIVRYAILVFVVIAVLAQLGVETTSVLAVLGAAGLAIGLALQGTLSNIAAGLMLLWLRPFRAGDFIEVSSVSGTVREVGLFVTQLDSYDGIYNFVPNSELWNTRLINYSRNETRMTNMEIGISYAADIEKARQIMLDLAASDERVAKDPAPAVFVDNLGDSAVVMRYRVWIGNADFWATHRYLLEETKRRLDAAGIEIPFPQRVVHMVGDETKAA
jgi:small conductance mechanosensitive channel